MYTALCSRLYDHTAGKLLIQEHLSDIYMDTILQILLCTVDISELRHMFLQERIIFDSRNTIFAECISFCKLSGHGHLVIR